MQLVIGVLQQIFRQVTANVSGVSGDEYLSQFQSAPLAPTGLPWCSRTIRALCIALAGNFESNLWLNHIVS
jgi:hypothetical protein